MRAFLILFAGIILTQTLVQEIFTQLAKQPYAEVAPLIGKIQEEAAHQPPPPSPPPVSEPSLVSPKK